ncbi:unnamed protein product [Mytilus coruscus]|uniref:DUF5641 domain-containing protein n=1 Tax=Mytilus coruscus TaxID=42192 RepID=A0A6J8EG87_MYTCO|nr:unnamed protein product [Mytilus coruscus]
MTTEEFIRAFRRFVSTRGTPSEVISDNASHFKLGNPSYKTCETSSEKLKKLWRKGQNILNSFWKTWREEYLLSLRERKQIDLKCGKIKSTISPSIGSVVIIKEDLPRGMWKLGRIVKLIQSNDGQLRRGYLFNHSTTILASKKNWLDVNRYLQKKRSSSNNEQYYDDVSEDDTILDLINDAIETEKQRVVPSMSVEEFLDSLDNISDDEINDCTVTDEHEEEYENTSNDVDSCGTSDAESRHSSYDNISDCCKSDDQPESDINNNTNDIIIVSDDDDDDINDERSLMTIGNSTIQQTLILTFQRTLTTIDGQTYVSDFNMEQDIYEHLIQ